MVRLPLHHAREEADICFTSPPYAQQRDYKTGPQANTSTVHHAREEADICFTSPPYAQQRDYKTGPQDWDALMQGVFSILPVKHGAQVLVNLRGVGASVLVNLRGVGASFTSAGVMNP